MVIEKFNRSELAQKIHASRDRYQVHAHQFWWVWLFQFRRYGYLSKTAKFPFWGMDYSPLSSKNSIDRNRLKKFMQVGIDVKCMHTNFGECDLSGFGDKISLWSIKVEKFTLSESAQKIHASRDQCHVHAHQFWWAWSSRFRRYGYLSKTAKFHFWGMDYSPWSSKNLIIRNRLKKFMQVGVNVTCMYISFGGRGLSGFRDIATFRKRPNFPFRAWYSPWSSKNLINRNRLKKFMQVGVNVTCMYISFGGRGLSSFRDIATFKNGQISLSGHGL